MLKIFSSAICRIVKSLESNQTNFGHHIFSQELKYCGTTNIWIMKPECEKPEFAGEGSVQGKLKSSRKLEVSSSIKKENIISISINEVKAIKTKSRKHKPEVVQDEILNEDVDSLVSKQETAKKRKVGRPKKSNLKDDTSVDVKTEPNMIKIDTQLTDKIKAPKLLKGKAELKKEKAEKKKSAVKRTTVKPETPLRYADKYVGAHLSIAGGLYKCIEEAVRIGARSCGLFLKSQRQWASNPLTEETITKFKETIQKHKFSPDKLLPHGSYLINCGSPDPETLEKSRNSLIDELQRCEMLGIPLYNFHPGSTCGKISVDECLDKISESINIAHSKTHTVTTVIENMSCQGNTIGGKLEELKEIIDRVEDKSRIGVCIDTCHAFAAGYDVSTETGFKSFIKQLDDIIGLEYLKAVHLNDSKGKLGCHLDRHENIGKGYIGLNGFKLVMNEPSFNNIPMILETPLDLSDEEEIQILNSL